MKGKMQAKVPMTQSTGLKVRRNHSNAALYVAMNV